MRSAILAGLAVGLLMFFILFGFGRAIGEDAAYLWPAGDQAQHIAGAFAYLDGRWGFPLFQTDRINFPDGVNIIFTDSAPFAGLLAKIVTSISGWRFNYLGSWLFILWLGQAVAAACLVRQLGMRHWLYAAAAAMIAISFPTFLNRHFHLALQSHFLVLAAFVFYFRTVSAPPSRWLVAAWYGLLGIAIWTHAYLFIMSFAIFTAALGDVLRCRLLSWRSAGAIFAGAAVWCLALALIGGYQTVGDTAAIGYGTFHFDLSGYFWPYGSVILPAPMIVKLDSAFEGYNYIGFGGLLLVFLAILLLRPRHLRRLFARYLLLMICLLGMLAFAITFSINLGGQEILRLPAPPVSFPFSTFRASARFAWPLGYFIVFASFVFVLSRAQRRSVALALVLAVAVGGLEFVDSQRMVTGIELGWRAEPKPLALQAIDAADTVSFDPPIDCIADAKAQTAAIEVLALAARAGKRVDSAHLARAAALDCSAGPKPHELRSLLVTQPDSGAAKAETMDLDCKPEDGLLLCRDK